MAIERFEDLKSWQEGRKLEQVVYRLTKREGFRSDRSPVSAPPNSRTAELSNAVRGNVALDQSSINQAAFDETYHQAEIVGQLISGAIESLDRQIRRWSTERSGRARGVRRHHP